MNPSTPAALPKLLEQNNKAISLKTVAGFLVPLSVYLVGISYAYYYGYLSYFGLSNLVSYSPNLAVSVVPSLILVTISAMFLILIMTLLFKRASYIKLSKYEALMYAILFFPTTILLQNIDLRWFIRWPLMGVLIYLLEYVVRGISKLMGAVVSVIFGKSKLYSNFMITFGRTVKLSVILMFGLVFSTVTGLVYAVNRTSFAVINEQNISYAILYSESDGYWTAKIDNNRLNEDQYYFKPRTNGLVIEGMSIERR